MSEYMDTQSDITRSKDLDSNTMQCQSRPKFTKETYRGCARQRGQTLYSNGPNRHLCDSLTSKDTNSFEAHQQLGWRIFLFWSRVLPGWIWNQSQPVRSPPLCLSIINDDLSEWSRYEEYNVDKSTPWSGCCWRYHKVTLFPWGKGITSYPAIHLIKGPDRTNDVSACEHSATHCHHHGKYDIGALYSIRLAVS